MQPMTIPVIAPPDNLFAYSLYPYIAEFLKPVTNF